MEGSTAAGYYFIRCSATFRKGNKCRIKFKEEVVVPSIFTSNIEAMLKRIEKFGGRILKDKTPISDEVKYGYFALFEDPNGNRMCLFSRK